MENGPFIVDFPIKTSIYEGFSMAMLNNQRVFFLPFLPVFRACGSYHWLLESLGSLESPGDRCFWTMACHHCPERPARWCPSSLAKLVNITPIKPMVYGRYNELVNGVYKPTYNWGAPSCGEWWQSGRVAELVFFSGYDMNIYMHKQKVMFGMYNHKYVLITYQEQWGMGVYHITYEV